MAPTSSSLFADNPTALASAASSDTPMPDATTSESTTTTTPKKRKRKDATGPSHVLFQTAFRAHEWTYFHLSLTTPSTSTLPLSSAAPTPTTNDPPPSLDETTISSLLSPPLIQYLGLMGASIAIDILKVAGREVWVRVPRQDAKAVRASLAGWIGAADAESVLGVAEGGRVRVAWRVVGEMGALGVGGGDGSEVFGG
ncbi:hypothetical protein BS50DRAFT_681796 [Corynespora cassiicola Philippines]|uniref:Ribonucleases P/MRP subunit Pop8-like domain-containing protein n=1 Tax=Corynespora cassiicola Philippines TaxID=1448308 RepID=A0A2T2N4Y2_CORCC|nr:hypothetical protein BS50DRAFT_681796 [Corynespora cassiicola Philippines]